MTFDIINCTIIFLLSSTVTFITLKILPQHLKFLIKEPNGPQKIHNGSVSRFGGFSIFLSFFILILIGLVDFKNIHFYLLISIPVFLIAFLEDITQSVKPKYRLMGSFFSGVLFIILFNILISRTGIGLINSILEIKIIAIIFTLICIIYLTQAYNIIDGLNGLALFSAILSFIGISFISFNINDYSTLNFSNTLILILLGIFIFNFPLGKIFIGDSGAYLIGLFIAVSIIILIEKNNQLSPFIALQIIIYPAYELFRSIIRRLLNKKNILQPDKKHLHSIMYQNGIRLSGYSSIKNNAFTSIKIMSILSINTIFLINFYKDEKIIIFGIFMFIFLYEILYFIQKKQLK